MTEEKTAKAATKKKDRVFQCLTPEGPTALATYMSPGIKAENGTVVQQGYHVLSRDTAGRFILRKNASHYEEQLETLRAYCKDHPDLLAEADFDKPAPKAFAPAPQSAAEEIRELKRREAEDSELITQLKEAQAKQAEDASRTIAELQKQVAELQGKKK